MAKRFRMKAKMLEDADVQWVSLVERPANRIPFRITKMDSDGKPLENPEDRMISLTNLFSRKKEDPAPNAAVNAVAVSKEFRSFYEEVLKAASLDIDAPEESDDTVLFVQHKTDEEGTVIVLNDAMAVSIPRNERLETTSKAFAPYTESEKFTDNLKAGTFVPGIAMATDVLLQTFGSVLRSSEGVDEVRSKMQRAVREYAKHILALTDELPDMVFKMEALPAPENVRQEEDMTDPVEKAETEVETTEVIEEAVEKAETEVVQPETEEASKAETVEVTEEVEPVEAVEKTEAPEAAAPDISAVLKEALAPAIESLSALKEAIAGLTETQKKLEERLDSVEETARKTDQAVSGTVRSNSDSLPDDSLGTLSRHSRAARKSDDDLWAGSALDKIISG